MTKAGNSQIMRTITLLITIFSLSFPAYAKYGSGTGEPNDPYQIATAADLIALGETPDDYDKYFILMADIDLDPNLPGRKVFDKAVIAPDINEPNEWWNFDGTSFTGVFDGNGYAIKNLKVTGGWYLGLFGSLGFTASVSNLGVQAVEVNGTGRYVGGLAGYNDGSIVNSYSSGSVRGTSVGGLVGFNIGKISNSNSSGSVSGNEPRVGGLVGYNGFSGSIDSSHSSSSVSGTDSVGGLVGKNGASARIATSYSSGSVSGTYSVGGLVGANGGIATQCYSTGSVSGTDYVGGLVGYNGWRIFNSYSSGSVSGTDHVGGLVGYYGRSIVASFWDIQTSGQATSAGGTGKTTAEMQMAGTFLEAGWDFVDETDNGTEDIWKIAEGLGYPRLSWEKYSGGTGEPNDPYQIATAEDLMLLGDTPEDYDKHFILTADIDLDPNLPGRKVFDKAVIAPDTNDMANWFQGTPFTGVFDGNGHTISHLTIFGQTHLGLFGSLWGVVKDLGVVDANTTSSGDIVGGLVGYNRGNVTWCYSTGTVNGMDCVGGLVGYNYSEE